MPVTIMTRCAPKPVFVVFKYSDRLAAPGPIAVFLSVHMLPLHSVIGLQWQQAAPAPKIWPGLKKKKRKKEEKPALHEGISNLSMKLDLCSLIGFSKSFFSWLVGLWGVGGVFVSHSTAQTTKRLIPNLTNCRNCFPGLASKILLF